MEATIKYIDLPLSDFSPVLIRSYLFTPDMSQPRGKKYELRLVEHYEFEFILESLGGMMSNDKEYDLVTNDIVFRRPGQTTQGLPPYNCYTIIFDIIGKNQKKDYTDNSKTLVSHKNPVLDAIPLIFNTQYSEKYIPLFDFVMKEHVNPSATSDIVFKMFDAC